MTTTLGEKRSQRSKTVYIQVCLPVCFHTLPACVCYVSKPNSLPWDGPRMARMAPSGPVWPAVSVLKVWAKLQSFKSHGVWVLTWGDRSEFCLRAGWKLRTLYFTLQLALPTWLQSKPPPEHVCTQAHRHASELHGYTIITLMRFW